MTKRPEFADLGDLAEDTRINTIGHQVMVHHKTVSFITDADPGKAERYIEKLKLKFPGIHVIERGDGPVAGAVWVKVGPPEN